MPRQTITFPFSSQVTILEPDGLNVIKFILSLCTFVSSFAILLSSFHKVIVPFFIFCFLFSLVYLDFFFIYKYLNTYNIYFIYIYNIYLFKRIFFR